MPDPPTDEDRERDPRLRHLSLATLSSEAQSLESLLAQTSPSSPDYGLVLVRLGHAYGALQGAARQEGDPAVAAKAGRDALDVYERFLRELPTHERVPEALYFGGLEDERQGRLDSARKRWFTLISLHPTHPLVPACYYAFGVLFRADAANDPSKLALAQQAFEAVVKYPDSPLFARARSWIESERARQQAAEP